MALDALTHICHYGCAAQRKEIPCVHAQIRNGLWECLFESVCLFIHSQLTERVREFLQGESDSITIVCGICDSTLTCTGEYVYMWMKPC